MAVATEGWEVPVLLLRQQSTIHGVLRAGEFLSIHGGDSHWFRLDFEEWRDFKGRISLRCSILPLSASSRPKSATFCL